MREVARAMARLLSGAVSEPAITPAQLARMLPHLLVTGAGPLAWWRLKDSPVAGEPAAQELKRAYLAHAAAGVRDELTVRSAFAALRAAGIEPVLSKGWSIARLYPEPGLRPSADVDLFVAPGELAAAERALAAVPGVDLHGGIDDLPGEPFDDVRARARLVALGDTAVRIPSPADLLRHVSLHLLRHAAWRPIWFADVRALVERDAAGMDWDRALGGAPPYAGWVAGVLGLASTLFGAPVPAEHLPPRLPEWLEPAVLDHWTGQGRHLYDGFPLVSRIGDPRGFWRALLKRWPSPLEATISRRAAFDDAPRLVYQLADVSSRAVRSLGRLIAA